jgi:putative ABC transport system substrate-binding protein
MMSRDRMNRRGFLGISLAAVAAPRLARAQQAGKVYRVAILTPATPMAEITATGSATWKAFFGELGRFGYVEGRNLTVVRLTAEGDERRLPELARQVVRLEPDIIFAVANRSVAALRAANATHPVVAVVSDPVAYGFAANLARPGGNVTGFSIDVGSEFLQKHIELLREVLPSATRMAFLVTREAFDSRLGGMVRESAQATGFSVVGAPLDPPVQEAEYRRVFAAMARDRVDALLVGPGQENGQHHRLIVGLVAAARLPAIYFFRESVDAGGLMAYAVDLADMYRRVAGYIDRILKGANPAELPFQQPSKFELIVNLKTASALNLTVPEPILARADEIIE